MSKKNDDFFVEKKPWSEVKDQLLGCYFVPYMQKILYTHRPLVYVDCFAGKGKFDDGKDGSPLIALKLMKECCSKTRLERLPRISASFIDINYADDLRRNLNEYPNVNIVPGAYEDNIDRLLKGEDGSNVFLYIDPYGIKALSCSKFDEFARRQFNTIELLINMNSFGFIREACRVMGKKFELDDSGFFDDLVEYDSTQLDASDKSVDALNEIAGGDYWKEIIEQYTSGAIDGYKAEEYFSEQYCQRLSQSFQYVLNMPIRIKKGQHSKYRMIHATNHPDGCVLMADNICNRWELLKQIQDSGQLSFFQENLNNEIVDEDEIKRNVIEHFSQCTNWTSLTEAQAVFYIKYGAICKTGDIGKILKNLEKEGRLKVDRTPAFTKSGKPRTFMAETSKQKVSVRWVS